MKSRTGDYIDDNWGNGPLITCVVIILTILSAITINPVNSARLIPTVSTEDNSFSLTTDNEGNVDTSDRTLGLILTMTSDNNNFSNNIGSIGLGYEEFTSYRTYPNRSDVPGVVVMNDEAVYELEHKVALSTREVWTQAHLRLSPVVSGFSDTSPCSTDFSEETRQAHRLINSYLESLDLQLFGSQGNPIIRRRRRELRSGRRDITDGWVLYNTTRVGYLGEGVRRVYITMGQYLKLNGTTMDRERRFLDIISGFVGGVVGSIFYNRHSNRNVRNAINQLSTGLRTIRNEETELAHGLSIVTSSLTMVSEHLTTLDNAIVSVSSALDREVCLSSLRSVLSYNVQDALRIIQGVHNVLSDLPSPTSEHFPSYLTPSQIRQIQLSGLVAQGLENEIDRSDLLCNLVGIRVPSSIIDLVCRVFVHNLGYIGRYKKRSQTKSSNQDRRFALDNKNASDVAWFTDFYDTILIGNGTFMDPDIGYDARTTHGPLKSLDAGEHAKREVNVCRNKRDMNDSCDQVLRKVKSFLDVVYLNNGLVVTASGPGTVVILDRENRVTNMSSDQVFTIEYNRVSMISLNNFILDITGPESSIFVASRGFYVQRNTSVNLTGLISEGRTLRSNIERNELAINNTLERARRDLDSLYFPFVPQTGIDFVTISCILFWIMIGLYISMKLFCFILMNSNVSGSGAIAIAADGLRRSFREKAEQRSNPSLGMKRAPSAVSMVDPRDSGD